MGDQKAEVPAAEKAAVPALKSVPLSLIDDSPLKRSRPDASESGKMRYILEKRGQVSPIHVRAIGERFEIIDGHQVRCGLAALGREEALVLDHGEMRDQDALLLSLELNHAKCEYDHVALGRAFAAAVEAFGISEVASRVMMEPEHIETYAILTTRNWEEEIKNWKEAGESQTVLGLEEEIR